ncbi:MAG: hypothetical protein KQJ78_12775 [Deltaproteobacteria bacterium]|nr:hypothetical protein [Deltaproteobacteria bacterium]
MSPHTPAEPPPAASGAPAVPVAEEETLAEVLARVWPTVRQRHLYPRLPPPRLGEPGGLAVLELTSRAIVLAERVARDLARELGPEAALTGLLDHAVGHYLYCPFDLATHLALYGRAKAVLGEGAAARRATDLFLDAVADTMVLSRLASPLPRVYALLPRDQAQEALLKALEITWQKEMRAQGDPELARAVAGLPWLEKARWPQTLERFCRLLESQLRGAGGEEGGAPALGAHSLSRYSPDQVRQGLGELARRLADPPRFGEIVGDWSEELAQAAGGQAPGLGLGAGAGPGGDNHTAAFYLALAGEYALPLRRAPQELAGAAYPHHHRPWELGGSWQDLDVWTSFGMIMPGISQTWRRQEGRVFAPEARVPDCLIAIDSSGSMPHPGRVLSPAVLGAGAAADAYLQNGARVAVVNFSDADRGGVLVQGYSPRREEVFQALAHYWGGGTRLRLADLDSLQLEPPPDLFLITDLEITNLTPLMSWLKASPNRVLAVHLAHNPQALAFRDGLDLSPHVTVQAVLAPADIPALVLGRVRRNLGGDRRKPARAFSF